MKPERLDKILSGTGLFTRSRARELILSGAVSVDGSPVRRPEEKVLRSARITAAGEEIDGAEFVYYQMNKPAGYVSGAKREGRYPAVTELLPEHLQRRGVFCVGRLDADVTGLLILTDDGAYAHRVTSPRSEIPKQYEVRLDGPVTEDDAAALRQGVSMGDGTVYRPAELLVDREDPCHGWVTVTEGKYHEVKNLMLSLGRRVTGMRRIAVGGLELREDLKFGDFYRMSEEEAVRVFIYNR